MKANTTSTKTAVKKTVCKKSVTKRTKGTQRPTRAKSSGNGNAGHGGKRRGAGRKPSSATNKTREIADQAAEDGELLPLSYLLQVLRTGPDELRGQYEAGELDDVEYRLLLESASNAGIGPPRRRRRTVIRACPPSTGS